MLNVLGLGWGKLVVQLLATPSISSGSMIGFGRLTWSAVGNKAVYTPTFPAFYRQLSTIKNCLNSSVVSFFIPTIHSTYNNDNNINLFNYYLYTQEARI